MREEGSVQLRRYRLARADGMSREDAADLVGMGREEARLTDIAEQRGELGPLPAPPPLIGHNQPPEQLMSDNKAADQLRLFIERIERLEEEKKGMLDDIRDVYVEAKSTGFDAKTMRAIVRLRKMEKHARDEAQSLLETYANALGMQLGLGL